MFVRQRACGDACGEIFAERRSAGGVDVVGWNRNRWVDLPLVPNSLT